MTVMTVWLNSSTQSAALGGLITSFNLFLPDEAANEKVPVLVYLAGLTCTEDTGYETSIASTSRSGNHTFAGVKKAASFVTPPHTELHSSFRTPPRAEQASKEKTMIGSLGQVTPSISISDVQTDGGGSRRGVLPQRDESQICTALQHAHACHPRASPGYRGRWHTHRTFLPPPTKKLPMMDIRHAGPQTRTLPASRYLVTPWAATAPSRSTSAPRRINTDPPPPLPPSATRASLRGAKRRSTGSCRAALPRGRIYTMPRSSSRDARFR